VIIEEGRLWLLFSFGASASKNSSMTIIRESIGGIPRERAVARDTMDYLDPTWLAAIIYKYSLPYTII
jgi:hypothetical protein